MIASNTNRNFLSAHYEWLALGFAVLVAVGAVVFAVIAFGEDPEEASEEIAARFSRRDSSGDSGIKKVDLAEYQRAASLLDSKKVPRVSEIDGKDGSFLASAARVFCEFCHRPMPFAAAECPFCKKAPAVKELPVSVVDTDGDGMTDDWEKKYGFDPADPADASLDKDGDGFTNLEEFLAKTDPTNRSDHPDYLDSLSIALPLVETKLPFFFERIMPLPGGVYKFYFKDPKARNDYGTRGVTYECRAGDAIGKTGYTVVSFNQKQEKRQIKAAKGEQELVKTVDVSTATIERKSDHKRFDLLVGSTRYISVDVQARLLYNRGGTKEFKVVKDDVIDLNGTKYKVKSIETVGKTTKVSFVDTILGDKIRVIEALEQ